MPPTEHEIPQIKKAKVTVVEDAPKLLRIAISFCRSITIIIIAEEIFIEATRTIKIIIKTSITFVEEKFWNVDTAFGLSPAEAVLPRFLFYFCEYFDFTTLDSSTTLPSLTKTNIQQIIFALPPIEEQKRILDKTNELFRKLDEIVLNLI